MASLGLQKEMWVLGQLSLKYPGDKTDKTETVLVQAHHEKAGVFETENSAGKYRRQPEKKKTKVTWFDPTKGAVGMSLLLLRRAVEDRMLWTSLVHGSPGVSADPRAPNNNSTKLLQLVSLFYLFFYICSVTVIPNFPLLFFPAPPRPPSVNAHPFLLVCGSLSVCSLSKPFPYFPCYSSPPPLWPPVSLFLISKCLVLFCSFVCFVH